MGLIQRHQRPSSLEIELRQEYDFNFATLRIIPWKEYFKDFSLEEMQAAIQKSEIKLVDGTLEINVPTNQA